MRWLVVLGVSIAALPVAAADRTAEIRLRHISVEELQTLLAPAETGYLGDLQGWQEDRVTGAGMVGEFAPRSWPVQLDAISPLRAPLIPRGIAGWSGDRQRNKLRISGTSEGIKRFKALVQLADVSPTQIRMTVRLFRAGDADLRAIDPELVPNHDMSDISIGMSRPSPNDWGLVPLSALQLEQLRNLPGEPGAEFIVVNNRAVNPRIPVPGQATPELIAVVPQFNADETVSFRFPLIATRDQAADSGALQTISGPTGAGLVIRYTRGRVAIKQGLLVRPRGSEWAAVLTPVEVMRPSVSRRR